MASFAEHESAPQVELDRAVLLRLLSRYVRPFAGWIAGALLLGLLVSGALYLRAYLIKPILDDVIIPASRSEVGASHWLSDLPFVDSPAGGGSVEVSDLEGAVRGSVRSILLLSLLVVFAMPAAQFARAYLVEYVLGRVYIAIQQDVCSTLLALPLRFHHERRRGDVLSRTLEDVRSAHAAVALLFDDFAEALLMTAVGVTVLFAISWQLAAVFVILGPTLFGVIALFTRRISTSAQRRQEKFGDVTQRLVEILDGIKVIKAFRAEGAEDAAFRRETGKLFRRSMKVVKNRVLARSLVEMLNNGIAIGTLLVGTALVLGGRWGLSPGDLAAFAAVLTTTYKPVKSLAKGWVRLADAEPSARRLFEVLDAPPEIRDTPDAVSLDKVQQGIELRGVSFSYGREPVLTDVSLSVAAGEVVAIVGPTGAGKTTLVDLLLRFYDPTGGAIEIDGIDLRRIRRDSLHERVAVVTQEPFLFDGSILDNIRYGRPGASDAEVLAAANAAFVDEFASELPDGYQTEVGAFGVRLSGGQRQRVTIARAILKDPAILIFDEATSSLDAKSERYVQDAIESLLGGRTVIVIAHRLSTVQRADKIAVLENGSIAQLGTHAELISRGGLYRELVELQSEPA